MIMVPFLVGLMLAIRHHYQVMARAITGPGPLTSRIPAKPIVVVPIARLDNPALDALGFARSISSEALAVHVGYDLETAHELTERWAEVGGGTELVIVESPYRAMMGPFLRYLDALQQQDPDRRILVILNEVVPRHWWDILLHNQTALRLKLRLFFRRNTIVADVPYHIPEAN
jgi:hypothetical protein